MVCLQPALVVGKFLNWRPIVILVIVSLITTQHISQSNPIVNNFDLSELLVGGLKESLRECQTDAECFKEPADIDPAANESNKPWLCVDSFCQCSPNFKLVLPTSANNEEDSANSSSSSSDRAEASTFIGKCEPFTCAYDEDCQTQDHQRVCHASSGVCRCRADFFEDTSNGRKCVPQYGLMPMYEKKARKFLNKNRISYREDIEHWGGQQILWLQYLAFVAFFVGQIALLVHYVVNRRHKMVKKLLLSRQNSDQLPITSAH